MHTHNIEKIKIASFFKDDCLYYPSNDGEFTAEKFLHNLITTEKRDTCVYFHVRKSDGMIFYVGIGDANRPYNSRSRSRWWKKTAKKHGYTIIIIKDGLLWAEACCLEIFYIAKFGRRDKKQGELVNLTDGGDGVKGYVPTEEQRVNYINAIQRPEHKAKQSESQTKRFENPVERQKQSERSTKLFSDPAEIEKLSKAQLKRYEDPLERQKRSDEQRNLSPEKKAAKSEKISKAGVERYEDQLERDKQRDICENLWLDPIYVEKTTTAQRAATSTEEFAKLAGDRSKQRWDDPEWASMMRNKRKETGKDPVFIKKMTEINRARNEKKKQERIAKGIFTKKEIRAIEIAGRKEQKLLMEALKEAENNSKKK